MEKFSLVIVEDDEDERFFMTEAFNEFEGFELLNAFANGDQILNWLQTPSHRFPDLIVSDLNMPGKNGYDLINEVRKGFPQIAVFITSTSKLQATREKCLHLGADSFLPKPDVFVDYAPFVAKAYEQFQKIARYRQT